MLDVYNRTNMVIVAKMSARGGGQSDHKLVDEVGMWLRSHTDQRTDAADAVSLPKDSSQTNDDEEHWDVPLVVGSTKVHSLREDSAEPEYSAGRTWCGLLFVSCQGLAA